MIHSEKCVVVPAAKYERMIQQLNDLTKEQPVKESDPVKDQSTDQDKDRVDDIVKEPPSVKQEETKVEPPIKSQDTDGSDQTIDEDPGLTLLPPSPAERHTYPDNPPVKKKKNPTKPGPTSPAERDTYNPPVKKKKKNNPTKLNWITL